MDFHQFFESYYDKQSERIIWEINHSMKNSVCVLPGFPELFDKIESKGEPKISSKKRFIQALINFASNLVAKGPYCYIELILRTDEYWNRSSICYLREHKSFEKTRLHNMEIPMEIQEFKGISGFQWGEFDTHRIKFTSEFESQAAVNSFLVQNPSWSINENNKNLIESKMNPILRGIKIASR